METNIINDDFVHDSNYKRIYIKQNMDYEKLYKEALERARALNEGKTTGAFGETVCEYIFPELNVSADERIRKQILAFLKEFNHDHYRNIDFSSWIDWLEKQGEQKVPINDFKAKDWYVSKVDGKIHNIYYSVDKVKPKFKVGDWIVWQDKCYIVNDNYCRYKLVDQNGLSTSLEYGTIDENARLWTIQDAKDGDVLACNEEILLFKSYSVQGRISLYCWYNGQTNTFHSKEVTDTSITTRNKICPVTKEQHDALFAKMKEAGYEWDEDKKELRKIVTPKFNIHDCVVKKHNSNINDFGYFIITDITGGKYWYNDRIICDITEQDEWELYEPVRQNYAAWSEEDEKIREALIKGFNECIVSSSHYPENAVKYWHGIAIDNILAWLEKQGEKSTNKIEPKFKIGDWIIFYEHHNSLYQVERIDNYRYYLRHYLGGTLSVHFDNELIRPWTIKDAKDGDVLAWDDSKCIALFKNIYDDVSFNSHGFVGHCTGTFESRLSYHDIEGAHPATKEQRDLLFQKMKEEGYEWDNKKKELKRFEKQVPNPKWTEEDEERLQSCISSLQGKGLIGGVDTINTKWLKSLKQRMEEQQ